MSPNDTAVTIVAFVAVVSLFYGPWQWVCTDWIRQTCFEARDKLFDLAADGRLEFSSPEYRRLRRNIEAEIRFAHEMTVPYLFVVGAYLRYSNPTMVERAKQFDLQTRSRITDLAVKIEVEKILSIMNKRVLVSVMCKSPLILIIPFIIVFPLYFCIKAVKVYARLGARFANSVITLGVYLSEGRADTEGAVLPSA